MFLVLFYYFLPRSLRQGLSLSLDIGWQRTRPRNLTASAHFGTGVTNVSINARDLNLGFMLT